MESSPWKSSSAPSPAPSSLLHVSPSTTTSQLKLLIRNHLGTPTYQQRLLFHGLLLNDTDTLLSRGVLPASELCLVISISKKTIGNIYSTRSIFIKTMHSEIVSLDVQPSDTMDRVECLVQEKTGVMYWRQILRFDGRVLGG